MLFKRSFRHWSIRYIVARLREMAYQRRSQHLPWLTEEVNNFLDNYLLPSDVGLEFGSGRSTLWFARRVKRLVSLEHDGNWYNFVKKRLEEEQQNNVDYHNLAAVANDFSGMTNTIMKITGLLDAESFDFVLIDGVCRDVCAKESLRLLRPGGMLIIDNVNRHLPSESFSPESRSNDQGPDGLVWRDIYQTIKPWRHYWTSSGVTDTAIYFKPYNVSVECLNGSEV